MKYTIYTNEMLSKAQRLKNEICSKGNLQEFSEVIYKLIVLIEKSNCNIYCSDICEKSSITQSINDSEKPYIRIGLKKRGEPLNIIWDILHEFGHYLSGKPKNNTDTLERELKAWYLGLKKLEDFPELVKYKQNYIAYQKKCLASYGI